MPKQVIKLEQFHGGLSTNSDPRDIADNELTAATDIMVDELGKIRTLGGTTGHDASSNPTITIESGYGLFQFSHDRIDGHLGEHLASGGDFTTGTKWTKTIVLDFPVVKLPISVWQNVRNPQNSR